MATREITDPTRLYVNLFLLEMLNAERNACAVRKSHQLPVLSEAPDTPEFERFRNRLKIMAELDPVPYPTPRKGSFDFAIDRQVDGQWFEYRYTIRMEFNDMDCDPSVELRAELIARRPVDPDLTL